MSDNVNNPSHYNTGSVETIDAIKSALGDAFLDYCRGNVLKYVWRCRHKGKLLEDLRKAAKYLEWAIEEAESKKPSKPQELAIPDGWRELEENEPLSEDDLFELDGEWVGHECDPSGGVYSSRIHCRHIRKIETENNSETPNSSLPDPGPGYRLLSKEPPEQVIRGDEFWQDFKGAWVKSENFMHEGGPQSPRLYYRRKIEPAEWIPKVGDKVRVLKANMLATGRVGVVSKFDGKTCSVRIESEGLTSFGLEAKDVELIEAAQ